MLTNLIILSLQNAHGSICLNFRSAADTAGSSLIVFTVFTVCPLHTIFLWSTFVRASVTTVNNSLNSVTPDRISLKSKWAPLISHMLAHPSVCWSVMVLRSSSTSCSQKFWLSWISLWNKKGFFLQTWNVSKPSLLVLFPLYLLTVCFQLHTKTVIYGYTVTVIQKDQR